MTLLGKVLGSGWAAGVVLGDDVRLLLDSLEEIATPAGGARLTADAAIPGALGAGLPSGTTVRWALARAGNGFRMTLTLEGAASQPVPGVAAASRTESGTGVRRRARLTQTGAGALTMQLTGAVVIEGKPQRVTTITANGLRLVPSSPSMLLPGGIGLTAPTGFTVGPGQRVEFVLPGDVPLFGGLVIPADLALGGRAITAEVPVRLRAPDPEVTGTIAWRTGPAPSLVDLVPVAISLALDLPVGALGPLPTGDTSTRLRLDASRPVDEPDRLRLAVGVESDAAEGVVHVPHSQAAKVPGAMVALAPGVLAEIGGTAASVAALLAAAAFAQAVTTRGGYTVHSAVIEAATSGPVSLRLDLSGSVSVAPWGVSNFLRISMDQNRPMRVRWRDVRATIDPSKPGAEALRLDFASARAEILDPGGWTVETAANLFEIVGTRSGSGSTWFEIDLRFTYDLGPVRVSGATVRATWDGGSVRYGIRGLQASIEVPGLVEAGGSISLADGVEVVLWAELVPLGASGFLVFRTATEGGVTRYEFTLGVDLPVPILLGPTGLSLYTIAATFGTNSAMPPLGTADPLGELRTWQPWDGLETRSGATTLGAGVVVGTAPDAGFAFNALGVFGISLPDPALRIALDAHFLAARYRAADLPLLDEHAGGGAGLALFGGLAVSDRDIVIGVVGTYDIPRVVSIELPVVGRFPFDSDDWFLHAGSDQVHGRTPAPLSATVFPGLGPLEVRGWGYVMIRGDGITNVGGTGTTLGGFAVAVGAGFTKTFGVRPVLWAEVSAAFVAAIGTRPFMLWITADLRGRAGIGPFSVGVDTKLTIQIGPDERVDIAFKACVSIDLWLTTLSGCLEIGTLDTDPAEPPVPADDEWPFPVFALADGIGRLHVDGVDEHEPPAPDPDPVPPSWSSVETVWPDAIPLLTFPVAPVVEAPGVPLPGGTQNGGITGSGTYRFRWVLADLALEEIGDGGVVAGTVSLDRSAWQAAAEDVVVTSGLRQLALLTTSRGVSLIHQSPTYQKPDRHPLKSVTGLCNWDPIRARAWSFGVDATADGDGEWHVPGRHGPLTPLSLRIFSSPVGFRARWRTWVDRQDADIPGIAATSGPYRFDAIEVEGTTLTGALSVGAPVAVAPTHPDRPPVMQELTIVLDEPIQEGALYLLARTPSTELVERASRARTTGLGGQDQIAVEIVDQFGDEGEFVVLRLELPKGTETVTWSPPWEVSPDVLGLHALAHATADAADTARAATDDAVANDLVAILKPWTTRTVLKTDARYRIRATLRWERLQDGVPGAFVPPPGSERTMHWFFRTAPARAGISAAIAPWKGIGAPVSAAIQVLARPTFDVSSIQRYFDRYSVAEGQSFVFTADAPTASFFAVHVAALAAAYGRHPVLLLRRIDRPRVPDEPYDAEPTITGVILKVAASLGMLVAETAAEAGCAVPPQGIRLGWPGTLERDASYELSVAFPEKGKRAKVGDPELAGITFSTSSSEGPPQLIESLGLADATSGPALARARATGDLPIRGTLADAPGTVVGDAALESMLDQLGIQLDGFGGGARSAVLWSRLDGGGWAARGLLVESDEPLIRDGGRRMALQGARIGSTELTIRRANAAGTRALWLATAPIALAAPTVVSLTATDRGAPFTRRLTVEPVPRFATALMAEAVR
ncbi:hypothetical protein [Agromyces marinus]|uniref:Tip attachment protein J domain-containing protein n=1 Tax=Agromyces marinus TaxID=1389020 RepID=A0ABN6Y9K1_9MICO|nr:hypothetical protein [Agromyces marinus]UIP57782.1 hypothetical protein DSM26151_06480 [Agromyces marinus]BDZ54040.1 hypothetical protein GCM10025870_11130 [Agromyces marinus]